MDERRSAVYYFFITLREPISFLFLALHWQVYWYIYCHHDLIEQDKLCRPWQRYQCHHLRSNAEQKGYTFLSSHNLYYTNIQLNANIKRQALHSGTLIANQVVGFLYIYTEQVYWHIYCHHDLIEQDKLCRPWQRYQCHHLRSNAEQKGYTFLSSHNLYYTNIQLNANIKRQALHSGTLIANQVVGFLYIYTEQGLIDCTQRRITITAICLGILRWRQNICLEMSQNILRQQLRLGKVQNKIIFTVMLKYWYMSTILTCVYYVGSRCSNEH